MCAVGSINETEQHDQRTIEPYQVSELYQAVKDRYFPSQVAPRAKSARTGRKRAKIG